MVQQLGANFMFGQNQGTQFETYRRHTWIVTLDGFDTELPAQECDLPGWDLEKIPVRHINDEVKIAGRPTFKDLQISFLDFINPAIFDQLYNWMCIAYNPETHQMGYASRYKKQGTIHQFDTEMNNERIWTCKGIWPTTSPGPRENLTYNDHGNVLLNVTFSVDYAFVAGIATASTTNSLITQV